MKTKQSFEKAFDFFSRGRYHQAVAAFKRISRQKDSSEETYVSLSKEFLLESYKLLGIKYISQELFQKAREMLDKGLEEFPENQYLRFYKGVVFNNASNFPEALVMFESISAEDPDFPSIKIVMGITLLNMGQLERVENTLRGIMVLPPFDATAHYLLGITHFRQLNFEAVGEYLRRTLELKKPFPEAQINMIAVHIISERYSEAFSMMSDLLPFVRNPKSLLIPLTFLKHQLNKDATDPIIRDYLGETDTQPPTPNEITQWVDRQFYQVIPIDVLSLPFHDSEGELVKHAWFRNILIHHYQQMIISGKDVPELHFRLGREYQRTKKYELAIRHFQKCLDRNPEFLPAKISMAFSYKEQNQLVKARKLFEQIYTDFKSMPDMILRSGEEKMDDEVLSVQKEDLEKELKILQMATQKNPHFADLYYNIGRIHYILDDPEQALSYFDKACTLNPNFIRANIGKAVALMQCKKIDQAHDILNNLSSCTYLYSKITYTLAVLYHFEGRIDKTRQLLDELITKENDFSEIAREMLQKLHESPLGD